jgi:SAM-dependent methyltransferase
LGHAPELVKHDLDTVDRFSDRVDNYVKYRPGYPPELLDLFKSRLGLHSDSVIADVGSGTGISSRVFLEKGNVVYGVEPNAAMRAAAERELGKYPGFRSVEGRSDETGLPTSSIDFIIAAQAFHWFEPESTRAEFRRILRPGGYVGLIWNERQLDSTPFLEEYEQFLLKYGRDYNNVRHENITTARLRDFFQRPYEKSVFRNVQVLDLDGLKGRMLSASYMPNESDAVFPQMIDELTVLFEKHKAQGKIEIIYDTNVFYTQL